jgi:hypothetical protein
MRFFASAAPVAERSVNMRCAMRLFFNALWAVSCAMLAVLMRCTVRYALRAMN